MDTGIAIPDAPPWHGPHDASVVVRAERLVARLSATLIGLPAELIDGRLEELLGLVGDFAGADRITVDQWSAEDRSVRRTHEWVRAGCRRGEEADPVATVPLVVGGTAIGAISFATLRHEREWSRELLDGLRLASDTVASALARQRDRAAVGRALAFERLVAELSASFVNRFDAAVDDHITGGLRRVGALLDLDRGVVAWRGTDHRVRITHQWTRDGLAAAPACVPDEPVPWVVKQALRGEVVVVARVDEGPEARDHPGAAEDCGMRSSVVVPFLHDREVIGSFGFATLGRERTWSTETVDRLRCVAEILGGALARSRAERALRAAREDSERLRQQVQAHPACVEDAPAVDVDEIVGRSPAIRAVLHKVDQVAPADVPVLLHGETGTGKELIARAIHASSHRRGRPLVAVNCAALPPSLIESELFGHERGAFTGAIQARVGRFELADGGTLFLDEIGDLEPALQAKLLRALQGGEIQRLGSSRTQKVDVRIITATNRNLETALAEGRFREDLYYRLGVFPIEVPPLRDRRQDIPLLVWHFIQSRQRALGRLIKQIPREGMDLLMSYDWPGNVRELQSVIDRALILSTGPVLRLTEPVGVIRAPRHSGGRGPERLEDAERAHIAAVLERCGWTVEGRGQAAERLGLRPSTLRNRMRKLGLRRPTTP